MAIPVNSSSNNLSQIDKSNTLSSLVPPKIIEEGLATIGGGISSVDNVFYNPVQVFNRDLSIIILRVFASMYLSKPFKNEILNSSDTLISDQQSNKEVCSQASRKLMILEPLAATGLRSMRYALELSEFIQVVVASDVDVLAVQTIEANKRKNSISDEKLKVVCCDANQLMYSSLFGGLEAVLAYSLDFRKKQDNFINIPFGTRNHRVTQALQKTRFNVIDLDPYGSVAGFLDAAVQSIAEGGLLCLTSTDMPVLCGNNPEVSFYKYGGTAIKARYMHEMALRLLIHAVATTAAKYKRVIQPLASCSVDFYVRCFVRVFSSPKLCKQLASKTALVLQCTQCDSFSVIPLGNISNVKAEYVKYKPPSMPFQSEATHCSECKSKTVWIGGPFYTGALHDKEFINCCLDVISPNNEVNQTFSKSLKLLHRLRGLLTAIKEELDLPLFYSLPSLVNRVKTETMKLTQFKSALLHLGYKVSHFHRDPQSIKTDAPNYVVFDILRKWAQINKPKHPENISILQKSFEVDPDLIKFEPIHPDALSKSVEIPKWLPNPAPFWGPKARARSNGFRINDPASKKAKT